MKPWFACVLCTLAGILVSCGGQASSLSDVQLQKDPPPALPSQAVLPNYDAAVARLLTPNIQYPVSNNSGMVVWNTRYYLESLLTAYNATGNQKYIDSFVATGSEVLSLAEEDLEFDIPDPSAPGAQQMGPEVTITGWPTNLGEFNTSVSVPGLNGGISFYLQVLRPSTGPNQLVVAPSSGGGEALSWQKGGTVLQTNLLFNQADLDALAAQPLDLSASLYRIFTTDSGLPAPGTYSLGTPIPAVSGGEQTAGILIPFLRFLLLARLRPSIADPALVSEWTSQVTGIAGSYEDQFVPDGYSGLIVTNPIWMANVSAGLTAPSDYINAEITARMLLYQLTGDSEDLSVGKGLFVHELTNLQTSSQGWVLLKEWPDAVTWSSSDQAPFGNIYSSFSFDTTAPSSTIEGGFLVEMMQTAYDLGLNTEIGIPEYLYQNEGQTFQKYIRVPLGVSSALVRSAYPTSNSKSSDAVVPTQYPFAGSAFLFSVTQDLSFICDNWDWMLANAQNAEQGTDVGYALRAWARSEAAIQTVPGRCSQH